VAIDAGKKMNVIDKVISALAGYFEQLKSIRTEYWLNRSDNIGSDSMNGIVTAFTFVLARSRFQEVPSPQQYGAILIVYVVIVCIVGGIACFVIKAAAENLTNSIRAFVATAWIASTIGGLLIASRIFAMLEEWIATIWIASFSNFGDPDVIGAALLAAIVGVGVVAFIGSRQTAAVIATSTKDRIIALSGLAIATFFGLAVVVGLGRND
jgi:hypothetical protein